MTYFHGIETLTDSEKVFTADFHYKERIFTVEVDLPNANVCLEKDLIFVRLICRQLPKFKDITSLFVDPGVFEYTPTFSIGVELESGKNYTFTKTVYNRQYALPDREQKLTEALYYSCDARKGDCGAPLVVTAGPFAGRIIGIHVAGTISNGIS